MYNNVLYKRVYLAAHRMYIYIVVPYFIKTGDLYVSTYVNKY